MLVTRWLRDEIGGLAAMLERNREKAALLYDVLDAFTEASTGATPNAVAFADERHVPPADRGPRDGVPRRGRRRPGLVELKGHRSVGGIRASIYNAMPLAGVERLADFMRAFVATVG